MIKIDGGMRTKIESSGDVMSYRFVDHSGEVARIETRCFRSGEAYACCQYSVVGLVGEANVAEYGTNGFGYRTEREASAELRLRMLEVFSEIKIKLQAGPTDVK